MLIQNRLILGWFSLDSGSKPHPLGTTLYLRCPPKSVLSSADSQTLLFHIQSKLLTCKSWFLNQQWVWQCTLDVVPLCWEMILHCTPPLSLFSTPSCQLFPCRLLPGNVIWYVPVVIKDTDQSQANWNILWIMIACITCSVLCKLSQCTPHPAHPTRPSLEHVRSSSLASFPFFFQPIHWLVALQRSMFMTEKNTTK